MPGLRQCITHRDVFEPDPLPRPIGAPGASEACGPWCPKHGQYAGDVNDLADLLTDPHVHVSSTGSYLDAESA